MCVCISDTNSHKNIIKESLYFFLRIWIVPLPFKSLPVCEMMELYHTISLLHCLRCLFVIMYDFILHILHLDINI